MKTKRNRYTVPAAQPLSSLINHPPGLRNQKPILRPPNIGVPSRLLNNRLGHVAYTRRPISRLRQKKIAVTLMRVAANLLAWGAVDFHDADTRLSAPGVVITGHATLNENVGLIGD